MENILTKPEPRKETLGDGKEYIFSPPTLGILAKFEQESARIGQDYNPGTVMPVNLIVAACYARMKPNHKDMTPEKVGELFDTGELIALAGEVANELGTFIMTAVGRKPKV